MSTKYDMESLRAMVRRGEWDSLRGAELSRFQIRQWVMPELRQRQGETAQVFLPFRTNWAGTGQMSRYAA